MYCFDHTVPLYACVLQTGHPILMSTTRSIVSLFSICQGVGLQRGIKVDSYVSSFFDSVIALIALIDFVSDIDIAFLNLYIDLVNLKLFLKGLCCGIACRSKL